MNTQVGKSVGFALLMAAGLLAALFAMGVFSASGVGAQTANCVEDSTATPPVTCAQLDTGSFEINLGDGTSTDAIPAANIHRLDAEGNRVTPAATDYDPNHYNYEIVVPDGTAAAPGITTLTIVGIAGETTGDGATMDPVVSIADAGVPDAAGTATADHQISLLESVPAKFTIMVEDDGDATTVDLGGATTYTFYLTYASPASSMTAGASIRLALTATLSGNEGDVITIKAADFGLPSTIDTDHVTINNVNPSDVSVSGDTIEVVIPDMDGPTATAADDLGTDAATTIRISSRVGITNPTTAGLYGITINDDATSANTGVDEAVDAVNVVKIESSVSLDPKKGSSTADVTVTGKGFSTGSATVFIDKTPGAATDDPATTAVDETEATYEANNTYDDGVDVVIASGAAITDGSFTATIAGIDKPTDEDSVTISAFDGAGNMADNSAVYTFGASLSTSPEKISWGQTLTIKMTDNIALPTEVRFGGNNRYKVDVETGASATEAKVVIPPGVPVGSQRVEVISSAGVVAGLSGTVEIVALVLNVTPSDVVPGQQVTISGGGFVTDDAIDSIEVGGKSVSVPSGAKVLTGNRIRLSAGVPLDVGTGSKKVVVESGSRVGEATVTVAKPSISVNPSESPIGSTVRVTGSGFAAAERVEVLYDDQLEDVGVADGNGNIDLDLTIPSDAGIGQTKAIKVQVRNEPTINASADHMTPGSQITVSPEQVQAGGEITVSGINFRGFSSLRSATIGTDSVLPVPAPLTERDGSVTFTVTVLAGLSTGTHTITIEDGARNSASETFSVTDTPVSNAPADVFASLGDNLQVVWQYDNATSMWASYDPAAPAELNDLDAVSSGDIVWVEVTADQEFQGQQLYAGWNLITLN